MIKLLVVATLLFSMSTWAFAADTTSARTDDALLYEAAYTDMVRGDFLDAHRRLDQLISRYPLSPFARQAQIRQRHLLRLGLSPEHLALDQSGRIGTLIFSTLYGTWLGVGTAIVADFDSDDAMVSGMMIGAPLGLATARALTRHVQIGTGRGAMIRNAGLWGSWQGFGWAVIASRADGRRPLTGATMAGGLAGIAGTSLISQRVTVSSSDAAVLQYAGLWGSWFAFCVAVMAEQDGDPAIRTTLVGGNLGLAAMTRLLPRLDISHSRARLINLGGIVGTFGAAGAVGLMANGGAFDGPAVPMGMVLAGGVAGLWIGSRNTREAVADQAGLSASPDSAPHLDYGGFSVGGLPHIDLEPGRGRTSGWELRYRILGVRF